LKEYVDKEDIDFDVKNNLEDIMQELIKTVRNRKEELAS
jgi:hypothetical protein